jgi:organic hydroperoxide reductase OsmC/OhrA
VTGALHEYQVTCRWEGSTGVGYDAYDRAHTAFVAPAHVELALASDPAFLGNPKLLNPEQLFVLAACSCQLLSFLAVSARARIDVVAYADEAEAVMPEDDPPVRITRITLRPRITVRGAITEDRLRHLCQVAHRECFIANSVTTEMTIEPTLVVTD